MGKQEFKIEIKGVDYKVHKPVFDQIHSVSLERDSLKNGKIPIDFIDWLMTNCELSKDQTIWSYDSEDYCIEGIYELFKINTAVNNYFKNEHQKLWQEVITT